MDTSAFLKISLLLSLLSILCFALLGAASLLTYTLLFLSAMSLAVHHCARKPRVPPAIRRTICSRAGAAKPRHFRPAGGFLQRAARNSVCWSKRIAAEARPGKGSSRRYVIQIKWQRY